MIHRLELENYRGFRHYELAGLARVNLLVGKNNSGKTSILEAIQILASHADARVLAEIAGRRSEGVAELDPGGGGVRRLTYINLFHLFHGHEIRPGSSFAIHADHAPGMVGLRVKAELDEPEPASQEGADLRQLDLFVEITGDKSGLVQGQRFLGTQPEGGLVELEYSAMNFEDDSVRFVRQDSLDRASMGEMWDRILTEGREEEVEEAMRILEPSLSRIVFLSSQGARAFRSHNGIFVGFKGDQRRYPLGSYGEGMRRILALALALATAKGGVLLVDEIDTGLHYSVLEDVWRLVVETAKRLDIQVFATTHSSDCLRSLASLGARRPDLAKEISVQKIERELDEAVALDAEQIQIAVEQEIEVR
jgi:energy-coupling factor transporter ATP-binding protein EcfA2